MCMRGKGPDVVCDDGLCLIVDHSAPPPGYEIDDNKIDSSMFSLFADEGKEERLLPCVELP